MFRTRRRALFCALPNDSLLRRRSIMSPRPTDGLEISLILPQVPRIRPFASVLILPRRSWNAEQTAQNGWTAVRWTTSESSLDRERAALLASLDSCVEPWRMISASCRRKWDRFTTSPTTTCRSVDSRLYALDRLVWATARSFTNCEDIADAARFQLAIFSHGVPKSTRVVC